MDDNVTRLIAAVEVLVAEVRETTVALRGVTERLASGRSDNARRQQNYRDRHRNVTPHNNVTRNVTDNVTPQVVKDQDLELDQDLKSKRSAARNVTERNVTPSPDHAALVAYGVNEIAKATGREYAFTAEDGGQTKKLLKAFGLAGAKEVFTLAVERFKGNEFHRKRGLTFRIVANDANSLRTAKPRPVQAEKQNWEARAGNWQAEGFASEADWLAYRKDMEAMV